MLRNLTQRLAIALTLSGLTFAAHAESVVKIPAPVYDARVAPGPLQTAVLAGGCFWGVQGVYQHLKGVKNVVSGYAGGEKSTADYDSVSDGDSGHAESVQIVYDPAKVTYGQILQVYFSVAHDPTQLNRQGPDSGRQYRSSIFYADETQKKIALAYIAQLSKAQLFERPIVTKVDPLKGFYAAEGYHQDYLLNHPNELYILVNDLPKVRAFEQMWPALYSPKPVTVAGNH
jgi:peptide-methionine (S)-S-oxide reductase